MGLRPEDGRERAGLHFGLVGTKMERVPEVL